MRHSPLNSIRWVGTAAAIDLIAAGWVLPGPLGASAETPERVAPRGPGSPAWQLPAAFSLGRAVPADVCLYVHRVHNPERDWLRPRYKQFWQQVWAANPHELVKRLLLDPMPPERQKAFEQAWDRAVARIDAVDWDNLTRNEIVLLGRMNGLTPEVLLLLRDDAKTVEQNAASLRAAIEALAEADEDLQGIGLDLYGVKTVILASMQHQTCFQMARRGDLIALCYGQRPPELMDDVLGLLAGKSRRPALVDTPRFRRLMARMPIPEDDVAYVDINLAARQIGKAKTRPPSVPAATSQSVGFDRAVRRLARMLEVYDRWVSVGWTEGHRQHHQSETGLSAGAEQGLLYPAVARQRAFERFDRFIPAQANAFWLWAGVNPAAAYDAVLASLRAEADDPDEFMAEWRAIQQELGISLKQDLFDWLDGRGMLINLPARPERGSGSDLVLMLGVRDVRRAQSKVDQLVGWLIKTLGQGPVSSRPTALPHGGLGGSARFQQVVLGEGAAKIGFLVYGVADGWLMISTGLAALDQCLLTARGQAESIRANPRFKAEGLMPKGPVASASFVELGHLDRDLSRWLGLIGVVEQHLPAGPEPQTIKAVLSLLDRLSVPARKLDFYSSRSSLTGFDGKTWKTRSVTTYERRPASPG